MQTTGVEHKVTKQQSERCGGELRFTEQKCARQVRKKQQYERRVVSKMSQSSNAKNSWKRYDHQTAMLRKEGENKVRKQQCERLGGEHTFTKQKCARQVRKTLIRKMC